MSALMPDRDRARLRLALAAMLATALVGCSADKSDLEKFVRDERAKPGGAIEPLPTPRVFDTFAYKPDNRRSPFTVMLDYTPVGGGPGGRGDPNAPDFERPREYLEQFPLDALKMVGHVELNGTVYALVKDSDGAVHKVKSGNHLGQNHGKIVTLSETEIRISEIVSDGRGGYVSRDTSLSLGQ